MKWYKAYANLKSHPKRYRLEGALGIKQGLHYIHLWFSYVAEHSKQGDVSHFTKEDVARACEWEGDPKKFWAGLIAAGFIDKLKGGAGGSKLIAHGWFEENARFIKENEKSKPTGSPRVSQGLPVLQDSTGQDTTGQDKEQDLTAVAVPVEVAIAPKVQEPHLEMRDYWHSEFERRFKRKAAFIPAKWLVEAEKALLSQLTLEELKNRTHNCLEDGYKTNPRYIDFLKNNEDFATLRRFAIKGDQREYENKRGKQNILGTHGAAAVAGLAAKLGANSTPQKAAPPDTKPHLECCFSVKEEFVPDYGQAWGCTGCYRRKFEKELTPRDKEIIAANAK